VLFGGVGWFIVKPIQQLQHQTSLTKFKVSDFQLVSQKQQSSGPPRRDLFDAPHLRSRSIVKGETISAAKTIQAQVKPNPAPQFIEKPSAWLDEVKYVGYLKQLDSVQALITHGDEAIVVTVNQRVGSHYEVKQITPEAIYFYDQKTQQSSKIDINSAG
ncbi:MAG: hypothetical protein OEY38_21160, partial [Gammaproteobacteria bacterium]|nr:hypothetical protein [Gammaproteobacteria bacterium]